MDDFRLISPNQNYYVYGLIDPRNNEVFYVGKGKGNRYKSHLKSSLKDDNFRKKNRIEEIQRNGFDVKIVKLIDFLDEESAFKIEEIIIYNVGRFFFNEGPLLNVIRGGNIGREANLHYSHKLNTDFIQKKISSFNREFLNLTIKTSKINFLSELPFEKIYEYDFKGVLLSEIPSEIFFNHTLYRYSFNLLLEHMSPLMFYHRIYSVRKISTFHKNKYDNPISCFLPYDEVFIKMLENNLDSKINFYFDYNFYENLKISVKNEEYTDVKVYLNDEEIHDQFILYNNFKLSLNLQRFDLNKSIIENSILTDEDKRERDNAAAEWDRFSKKFKQDEEYF